MPYMPPYQTPQNSDDMKNTEELNFSQRFHEEGLKNVFNK